MQSRRKIEKQQTRIRRLTIQLGEGTMGTKSADQSAECGPDCKFTQEQIALLQSKECEEHCCEALKAESHRVSATAGAGNYLDMFKLTLGILLGFLKDKGYLAPK